MKHAWDLTALAGAVATVWGIWQIYPPAAWIAGGLATLAFSLWGAKQWAS